eukprot:gene9598-6746_t
MIKKEKMASNLLRFLPVLNVYVLPIYVHQNVNEKYCIHQPQLSTQNKPRHKKSLKIFHHKMIVKKTYISVDSYKYSSQKTSIITFKLTSIIVITIIITIQLRIYSEFIIMEFRWINNGLFIIIILIIVGRYDCNYNKNNNDNKLLLKEIYYY